MNITHVGNPGRMTVEVTGIDSTTRAQMAESCLYIYRWNEEDPVGYLGTEEEYARFRRVLDLAEGEPVRVHPAFRGGAA